ncbi:MAG: mechanosensitive ion channel, partial [Synergistaceae bacterium]|nr:mechanosensitive ion channel [Synergistaceae bacterium]
MNKKFFIVAMLFLLIVPSTLFGAESQELADDYITRTQNEISADLAHLRKSIETVLADIKLSSSDVERRIAELAILTEKSSEDMAVWGYTDEQREAHTQVLSQLNVAYVAYDSLLLQIANSSNKEEIDASSLENIASPDVNDSDGVRKEIRKISRSIDVQLFYLKSKLDRLKLELSEVAELQKRLKEAEEGGEALELPRTHILRLELAKLNVALTRLQVRSQRRAFDANVSLIHRLRRKLSEMQGKLIFPREVLDANLEKIQTRVTELTNELTAARKALDSANASLVRARAALGSADVSILTNASATYMARSARVRYWGNMVSLIGDEIELNREAQQVWRERFKLFNDEASGEEIWQLRDSAQTRMNELQTQLESVRTLAASVLLQIETLQAQAATEGLSANVQQIILQAAGNYGKIISDAFNRYESLIPSAVFLQQRLYNEANENISALRLAEKVSSFSKETVMAFLNTELWQGEGYSVTISKLIIAIVVFLSSFFLSSLGSNWIKRRMINRFKASVTAANGVQRIVFYILWVAFALIALNIVKIPLTAFAFMGGAFAVGIGFGMQNIFNNLISGFIVIFSRPFKVKDVVDVMGTQGTVTDIGSRSTTIKTFDGVDVILPNR